MEIENNVDLFISFMQFKNIANRAVSRASQLYDILFIFQADRAPSHVLLFFETFQYSPILLEGHLQSWYDQLPSIRSLQNLKYVILNSLFEILRKQWVPGISVLRKHQLRLGILWKLKDWLLPDINLNFLLACNCNKNIAYMSFLKHVSRFCTFGHVTNMKITFTQDKNDKMQIEKNS